MRNLIASYRQAYSGLPAEVWTISLVGLINRAGTMVVVFLPIWLHREHGVPEADAAAFMSIWGAGTILGVWLGGLLTDRLGAVPVQLASFAGVATGFLTISILPSVGGIAIAMFLTGLAGEAFRPANSTLLSELCPAERRTQAFALHRLAINLGWTIGPISGGFLSEFSWTLVFWVDAATCLVAGTILFAAFRHVHTHARTREETDPATRGPWNDRVFLAFVACMLLLAFSFLQFFVTLPLYLSTAHDWRQSTIGMVEAINPAMIVLIEMILVHRLRKANPVRAAAWGAMCVAIGTSLLWVSGSFAWVAFCVIWLTIGEMLEAALSSGFVANRAPDHERGRYMALFGASFSCAIVIAPLIAAAVRKHFGWTPLWIVCGVISLAATIGLFAVARAVDREA